MITKFDKNVNQFLLNFHTLLIIQSFTFSNEIPLVSDRQAIILSYKATFKRSQSLMS